MVTKVGHGPHGALCPGALDQSVLFQGVAGRQRAGPGDSAQLPNWMQVTRDIHINNNSEKSGLTCSSILGDTRVSGSGDRS